ncbi:GtrA family protein [bacterium]|nr:GtrA family protein [bacterium]
MSSKSRHELGVQGIKFFIVGITSVSIDLVTYNSALPFIGLSLSKGVGFLSGTICSYILNRAWTFKKRKRLRFQFVKYSMLYTTSLGLNIGLNRLSLHATNHQILLSFLIATGVTTIYNFWGLRYWVFR